MVSPKASRGAAWRNRRRWGSSGKCRTSFGNGSSLSSWRKTHPRPGAASALTPDRCSTASSSACAAGANGTDYRKSLGTTAPSIAPFNGGWNGVSCAECGEPWWRDAKSWTVWTGNGKRQTEPWARHVLGDLIGPNPTDRGKAGSKRSLLVDGEGGPLSITVAGANVHDAKLLEATLDAIVVERPQPTEEEPQHLCLDKGYDNPSGRGAATGHGYREHIRRIGEEKLDTSGGNCSDLRGSSRSAVSPIGNLALGKVESPRSAGIRLINSEQLPLARSGIRRAGGLWNGRWHGSPSAVRSWFATTRRRRTTSECYNSLALSCGSVVSGVWPF